MILTATVTTLMRSTGDTGDSRDLLTLTLRTAQENGWKPSHCGTAHIRVPKGRYDIGDTFELHAVTPVEAQG